MSDQDQGDQSDQTQGKLTDPIYDNPLEDFFESKQNFVEPDEYLNVPEFVDPTEIQVNLIDRFNRLKKDRTQIYNSIMLMSSTITKRMATATPKDWDNLHLRVEGATEALCTITKELKGMGFVISDKELMNFSRYSELNNEHSQRIKSLINALQMEIPLVIQAAMQKITDGEISFTDPEASSTLRGTAGRDPLLTTLIDLVKKLDVSTSSKQPNYKGISNLEIKPFKGDEAEYHFFRENFKASVAGKNLPNHFLALHLQQYLRGPALKLIRVHLHADINDRSYDRAWEILEDRYGGRFREEAYIAEQFTTTAPLKNFSYKELERMYDTFTLQYDYYQKVNKNELTSPYSMLTRLAKLKFTSNQSTKFIVFCKSKSMPETFDSLYKWIKDRYKVVQKSDREYLPDSWEDKGSKFVPNSQVTDSEVSDTSEEEEQSDEEEKLVLFAQNTKTGKIRHLESRTPKQSIYSTSSSFSPKKTVEKSKTKKDVVRSNDRKIEFKSNTTKKELARVSQVAAPGTISIQTLVCNVTSNGMNHKTVALIDTGSTMTCIDADFAKELKLPIRGQTDDEEINVIDRSIKNQKSFLVELQVSALGNDSKFTFQAWTIQNMAARTEVVDWSDKKRNFPHLKRVLFPKLPENPKIQIIFGADHTRLFVSDKTVWNKKDLDDPIAIKTFLGWTCIGRSKSFEEKSQNPLKYFKNVLS